MKKQALEVHVRYYSPFEFGIYFTTHEDLPQECYPAEACCGKACAAWLAEALGEGIKWDSFCNWWLLFFPAADGILPDPELW